MHPHMRLLYEGVTDNCCYQSNLIHLLFSLYAGKGQITIENKGDSKIMESRLKKLEKRGRN